MTREHTAAHLRRLMAMHLGVAGLLALLSVVALIAWVASLPTGGSASTAALLGLSLAALLLHGGMASIALAGSRPQWSSPRPHLYATGLLAFLGLVAVIIAVLAAAFGAGWTAVLIVIIFLAVAASTIPTLRALKKMSSTH